MALDLTQDAGWAEALSGADVLVHTASPFPMTQPKEEAALIRPAVDGARRALRGAQAAGIDRVVLTSSAVAVMNTELASGKPAYDEADWTDTAHPGVTAYEKSKTLAEQAAWDFVNEDAPGIALTVINPVRVLGAPLDLNYGTSVQVVERILKAQDPMLPRIGFPIVDVTDVAEMHLRAVERPETAGKRYIAAEEFLWFRDIAEAIKAEYPGRKVVTREARTWWCGRWRSSTRRSGQCCLRLASGGTCRRHGRAMRWGLPSPRRRKACAARRASSWKRPGSERE